MDGETVKLLGACFTDYCITAYRAALGAVGGRAARLYLKCDQRAADCGA